MKTIPELLSLARQLGIKLWAEGDRLLYQAPKGVLTPEFREQLKAQKTEFLTFLRKANLASSVTVDPIQPVSREGYLPQSLTQQRLWCLSQLYKKDATYNEAHAFRIVGYLQIEALEQSVSAIVKRHEVLRTTFDEVDGQPIQIIHPFARISLPVVELQQFPDSERLDEMNRLIAEIVQAPFDLVAGPLLRMLLIRVGKEDHVLVFVVHYMVFDSLSNLIFERELMTCYNAFATGRLFSLPELPIQYADFAVWQHQWVHGDSFHYQLSYWEKQLTDAPPVLKLPTDKPRPQRQILSRNYHIFELPMNLCKSLEEFSQREGVTLFMSLLAIFKGVLHRFSGQTDILVGSPVSGRIRPEFEHLIGLFTYPIVLRTDLSGNPTFRELLARVRKVALEAYAHQDVPFVKLVEALQGDWDSPYYPIMQVIFEFLDIPEEPLKLSGLALTPFYVEQGITELDLLFILLKTEKRLYGKITYAKTLFNAETIAYLIDVYHHLLETWTRFPDKRLADIIVPDRQ